jgi:hypothetical protein
MDRLGEFTMTKKVNAKSTKAEILEVLTEVTQEKSSLEAEIKKLHKELQSAAKFSASMPPMPATKVTETIKGTEPMKAMVNAQYNPQDTAQDTAQDKMNQIIESLTQLQLGFGGAVSDLSEKLTTEASALDDVQTLVTEELEILKELHGLEDVAETTLDDLIGSYEENSKTFEQEESEQRETLDQEMQDLRKGWRKEQETHQVQVKERNETHHKNRHRDVQEYRYNLELERQLDSEAYEENKKAIYKELSEIKSAQEKAWAEREKTISDREKAYSEAKAKVEAFPEELEKNIKNGKENGRNIGTYQAKVKADLREKEIEGQKRNYQLRIESQEETIKDQNARIQSLSKQLDAALKQVQDLAVKAIEGASNVSSFQAVKEILLEQQNKNQQKTK